MNIILKEGAIPGYRIEHNPASCRDEVVILLNETNSWFTALPLSEFTTEDKPPLQPIELDDLCPPEPERCISEEALLSLMASINGMDKVPR